MDDFTYGFLMVGTLLFGIALPIWLYIVIWHRFRNKKQSLEEKSGRTVGITWETYRGNLGMNNYLAFMGFQLVLLTLHFTVHEDFLILSGIMGFLSLLFIEDFVGEKTKYFTVSDFVTGEQMEMWMWDSTDKGRFSENPYYHSELKIIHGDYLPHLLDALPLIAEKERFSAIVDGFADRQLTPYEQECLETAKRLFEAKETELVEYFEGFLIAVGRKKRPEDVDARIQNSMVELEKALGEKRDSNESLTAEQIDPALKELYSLTSNNEMTDDIQEMAQKAIQDIEQKLEEEAKQRKAEEMLQSARVTVATARSFHQV